MIAFVEENYASGKMALRCLAHAVLDKKVSVNDSRLQDPAKFEDIESDLTFVGLTGILDPPRDEVCYFLIFESMIQAAKVTTALCVVISL